MSRARPGPLAVFLASGNAHKLREFEDLAARSGSAVTILSPAPFGGMPPVAEDTGTFRGNALKKARALARRIPPGAWALADDSGLCVDALGGAPGVESASYAGPAGDSAANLLKLIEAMRGVPEDSRAAHFVCVLALVRSDGVEHAFEGRCDGALLASPRGSGGFGYDPLFVPRGSELSFAQMDPSLKGRISHRALAWDALCRWAAA